MPRRSKNKKTVLGLTGGLGSGKSSVAAIFASRGARVIDADRIAHGCISRGKRAYRRIVSVFGEGVLAKNREIDRVKLGKAVFGDKGLLKKLNRIVHPEVIRVIKKEVAAQKKGVIVLDAPLLLEAGLGKGMDKLVVVTIDRKRQVRRLLKKTSLKKAEILKRIKSQIPLTAKARLADFIIDNNGTRKETENQVKNICQTLGISDAKGSMKEEVWKS
ncbi:MAG: dephospho-CoA kinase [Candidatus Omnitrophota bacterium]